MFRILHLSDIHIGRTYKEPESIACKIASDIDQTGLGRIHCIVVTGDIFDGQAGVNDSLIVAAVGFFETLLAEINSNQEKEQIQKEDVIFIPGNHDLIRTDDLVGRWSKYHDFLEKFYGGIPSFYDEKNYSLLKEYKEHKIAFVGFNSCEIEKRNLFDENYIDKFQKHVQESSLEKYGIDKNKVIEVLQSEVASEYDDYGYIPLAQVSPLRRKVKKLDDYTIVALFHHHFYLFPEVAKEYGDSSLIRNYTEFIQQLRYMNVSVVLHGHKHFALERPFIMDDYYESTENIIDVFAGGSVGTDRKEEHTFGILDLYEKKDEIKLRHSKFVYNGENLAPIVKKQVPPQKLRGRVVKLLEILNELDPEKYEAYEEAAAKVFGFYDSCNRIITWVSEAITGFTEIYKYLEEDYNYILFLFYAINYRLISYTKIVGKEETAYEFASKIWSDFYDMHLSQTAFTVSKEDYHKLFVEKELKKVTSFCDQLLNRIDNKKSQIYLAFTMLGFFFTDLYLVLTKYADDFKVDIKHKVNIRIEENKFHENVPAPRIVVKSDADRRSVYVDLLCNEATAHKMAGLFIKEFDLHRNKFEDYFKVIGLKMYYLLPRIDKDSMKNTLDNYNFEAYIPTLIPLLTGDNIYSSKVVFARELIQNSIDAISVREAKETKDFSKKILIEIKVDEGGKRYFKIIDHGTGMDRYKIERYFTSIGRSFYSGEEYEDLNISYKPISNFGIGFLSSFMVCREIDVRTKYYTDGSEGLKLHIPNYDGCFFIELDKAANVGTELKLYLEDSVSNKEIVDYIGRVMQDIKYPIEIAYLNEKHAEIQTAIPAHSIRQRSSEEEFKFFVPFLENGEIGEVDYVKDILSNQYMEKYEYGLFIHRTQYLRQKSKSIVLNSGIAVERASLREIFRDNFRKNEFRYNQYENDCYSDISVNFPSNWLQLDVAREKITELSDVIDKDPNSRSRVLGVKIADSLCGQISQFIRYSEKRKTEIPAIYLQDIIYYAIGFCGMRKSEELYTKLLKMKYVFTIEFSDSEIIYKIFRNGEEGERVRISYCGSESKKNRDKWLNRLNMWERDKSRPFMERTEYISSEDSPSRELIRFFYEIVQRRGLYVKDEVRVRLDEMIRNLPKALRAEGADKSIFKFLTILLLDAPDTTICSSDKRVWAIVPILETVLLQYFCVGAEETQELRITYRELEEILRLPEKDRADVHRTERKYVEK